MTLIDSSLFQLDISIFAPLVHYNDKENTINQTTISVIVSYLLYTLIL